MTNELYNTQDHIDVYNDIRKKLRTEIRACIVRPAEWDKLYTVAQIAQNYKSILFLTSNMDNLEYFKRLVKYYKLKNVRLETYQNLPVVDETNVGDFEGFDLFILDECHSINNDDGTSYSVNRLISFLSLVRVLGCTATPDREDGYPIVDMIFQGSFTQPYPLKNGETSQNVIPSPEDIKRFIELDTNLRAHLMYPRSYDPPLGEEQQERKWRQSRIDRMRNGIVNL